MSNTTQPQTEEVRGVAPPEDEVDDLDGLEAEIDALEYEADEFRPDMLAVRARHARCVGLGLDLQEELARVSRLFDAVEQFKAMLERAVAAKTEPSDK